MYYECFPTPNAYLQGYRDFCNDYNIFPFILQDLL